MSSGGLDLVLYVRRWCHLCDDMLAALEALRPELAFRLRVIDLDEHPELEERYGEMVPVLAHRGRRSATTTWTRRACVPAIRDRIPADENLPPKRA